MPGLRFVGGVRDRQDACPTSMSSRETGKMPVLRVWVALTRFNWKQHDEGNIVQGPGWRRDHLPGLN